MLQSPLTVTLDSAHRTVYPASDMDEEPQTEPERSVWLLVSCYGAGALLTAFGRILARLRADLRRNGETDAAKVASAARIVCIEHGAALRAADV